MIFNLLLFHLFISPTNCSRDTIPTFNKEIQKLERYIGPPAQVYNYETCYHYTALLKIQIDKNSKVSEISLSDNAPEWVQNEIERYKIKYANYKRLAALAKNEKLKNITFFYPLLFEGVSKGCKEYYSTAIITADFFKFNKKNISGNLKFQDPIIIWFYVGIPDHIIEYKPLKLKEPIIKQ